MEHGGLAAAGGGWDASCVIESLRAVAYQPVSGAEYPNGAFGRGLTEIARLIKARVGLEAATLDLPGWDSHFAQSSVMAPLMRDLASGLAALSKDLGADMATTIVVMTEFGRRVRENASLGTTTGGGV